MTVTKAELVTLLADATGMSKTDVEVIVNGLFSYIVEALQSGDRVEIRGFGSFYAKERDARLVKNPRTGQLHSVGHRFVPVFRPAKFFKETVNQRLLEQNESKNLS
ncbi:MAG: integration host factor subunit beta [Calditrichaeota bacterium]|nr:MAG: integration host factor subunit beta [Calditrichota bacterium]